MARLRNITILSFSIYYILWATSGKGKVNTIPYEFLFHSFLFLFFLKIFCIKSLTHYIFGVLYSVHTRGWRIRKLHDIGTILYLVFKRQTDSQQIYTHQSNILLTLRSSVVVVKNIIFLALLISYVTYLPICY